MRKVIIGLSVFIIFLAPFASFVPAHATFDPNDIIDDGFFNNYNSMSSGQVYPGSNIDTWINSSFPNSCIGYRSGFQFRAPDPTGYSPSGGFTYGGNVTAGQVIYDASQAYSINPQVLLTTLEKEQSLVSGEAGCTTLAYTGAAGYGCPDGGTQYSYSGVNLYTINGSTTTSVSGTCVNSASKAGFSQQVIHAAWLLKFGEERAEGNVGWDVQLTNGPENGDVWNNSDDPQSCYGGPMTQGTWQICPGGTSTYYDGYTTIDGTSVQISNGATAALYWYTPHLHGNQNFDTIYSSWFGDTLLGCGTNETMMPQVVGMYNPVNYAHVYTAYACEANDLGYEAGYIYQGAAWNTTSPTFGVPVWRLYDSSLNLFLWTTSQADINNATSVGYTVQGIAFYSAPPNSPNVYPVYRLYNPTTYQHIWCLTAGTSVTQAAGYRLEGVAFYSQ